MRAHQPGSTPIDIPETVPNPAYTPAPAPAPAPAPEKTPVREPFKEPRPIVALVPTEAGTLPLPSRDPTHQFELG